MGKEDSASVIALIVSGVALGASLAILAFRQSQPLPPPPPPNYPAPTRAKTRQLAPCIEEEEEHDEQFAAAAAAYARNRNGPSLEELKRNKPASKHLPAMGEELDGWKAGFSMMEARKEAESAGTEVASKTPHTVLEDLQKGNARFWTCTAHRPEKNAFQRRALITKQFPTAAVLGCADSRVPVEIVFDQGLGDLFVVRVAGNCLDTTTTASLQYAVHHLKVKVLVVLGHEGCGAIKAAHLPPSAIAKEPDRLASLLRFLKSGLDFHALEQVKDPRAHDREAVTANVKVQVEKLLTDECIMQKVRTKELIIVGAFYEISSGIVDFFHEVSEVPDDIRTAPSRGVMSRCNSRLIPGAEKSGIL